jgi:hypothetical protein
MEGIKAQFEKKDCYIVVLRECDSGILKPFDSAVLLITDSSAAGYKLETASKAALSAKMKNAERIKVPEEMEKRANNILKIWKNE